MSKFLPQIWYHVYMNNTWKGVKLRKIFPNEARDFTPWLEQHVDILDEIFEKNVVPYKREQKIGSLYVDLLLTDNSTKSELYIIENQYGMSDHDHFGKCLTYSYLLHPKKTVWIAEEFTKEHENILSQVNIDLIQVQFQIETNGEEYRVHIIGESKSARKEYVRKIEMPERKR